LLRHHRRLDHGTRGRRRRVRTRPDRSPGCRQSCAGGEDRARRCVHRRHARVQSQLHRSAQGTDRRRPRRMGGEAGRIRLLRRPLRRPARGRASARRLRGVARGRHQGHGELRERVGAVRCRRPAAPSGASRSVDAPYAPPAGLVEPRVAGSPRGAALWRGSMSEVTHSEPTSPAVDLRAYCARIGYSEPLTPTLETLAALQELHPAAIPFEAIDVLLDRGVDLAPAAVDAKLLGARRGGYCYEHTGRFKRVLEAIGFEVEGLIARVNWMAPRDAPLRPPSHMTLRVTIDGEAW